MSNQVVKFLLGGLVKFRASVMDAILLYDTACEMLLPTTF